MVYLDKIEIIFEHLLKTTQRYPPFKKCNCFSLKCIMHKIPLYTNWCMCILSMCIHYNAYFPLICD